jgi:hypothetical protein
MVTRDVIFKNTQAGQGKKTNHPPGYDATPDVKITQHARLVVSTWLKIPSSLGIIIPFLCLETTHTVFGTISQATLEIQGRTFRAGC